MELIKTPDKTTTTAPFIRDGLDIKRYLGMVIVALLPAVAAAFYFYGPRVLAIIAVAYIFGGLAELVFSLVRKKPLDEGFFVTGLIFSLILPPAIPLWIVAVGIVFGVVFGKEVFGGMGRNIFNPALVGRLFITITFPTIINACWQMPFTDAITSATPLVLYKTTQTVTPLVSLLFGQTAGSIGENFCWGIILGGIFLVYTKVANWRIPVFYIGTVIILSAIGNHFLPANVAPPWFQLLSGGLLFGAFFMATDPVTSPFTMKGKVVFGIGCGGLTVLIRAFSGYAEGVMFSIILLNALSPLIDHIVISPNFALGKICPKGRSSNSV
ncbi:MAG: RnfABCDGE type electron transport complex subunit D [Candidatus Omnitrophota bacterium]